MVDTKEIQVFISCPGDMTPEKDEIIEITSRKNNSLMHRGSKFRLKTLDFRTIIGSFGGRPQQLINDKFTKYDIYIGLLWMRFGTPSGGTNPDTGELYESGTEEEFEIASKRRREQGDVSMYMFFKEARGPKSISEADEWKRIEGFRQRIMPLGWVNSISMAEPNKQFTHDIHHLLEEWIRLAEDTEHHGEKVSFMTHSTLVTVKGTPIVELLIKKAEQSKDSINRTLSLFSGVQNPMLGYFIDSEGAAVNELVKTVKRLVVLGNAGSGKSTELSNLAHHYADESSEFIPVYQRLNTYVDEDLEDFLPQGWNAVPEGICLVILDGLDEVQPSNFNTLVRKLINFSEKHSDLRMVVSCRTNFYSLPKNSSGGTLSGFEVFLLEDLKPQNLESYIKTVFDTDAINFFKELRRHDLEEMVRQPFFLNMLLTEYSTRGNLDVRKADLLDGFISSRIALDQEHYELSVPLKDKEPYIVSLLQTVSLAMEYLGRNYLSYAELQKLLPDPEDVRLIKYSTAFKNFETDSDKWGFEHNNIQEYLAARALMNRDVVEIKSFLSIQERVIKPSWLNTLFFLMGILAEKKRIELINWILDIDPEVLVRIEPDKVDPATRLEIFKSIFENYKKQGVWLRSNKFTITELSRFIPVAEGCHYLLTQLNDLNNSRVIRLNALMVISSQKLTGEELRKAESALIEFAESEPDDHYIFHNIANALSELGLANKLLIERLMLIFGERKNQYVRSGLYQLIISAALVDEYMDYFMEGISLSRDEPDRDPVHLLDEDLLIKSAFSGPLKYESVVRLLTLYGGAEAARLSIYQDKNEVLRPLVDKAISYYDNHPELYDIMAQIYVKGRRPSDESVSEIIAAFFIKTGNDQKLFKNLFESKELGQYEKGMLYKYLLSKPAIDEVVGAYQQRNLTNKDVLDFYDSVKWYSGRRGKQNDFEYLTEQLNLHTTLLSGRVEIDHPKNRIEKTIKNTALYFSPEKVKETVVDFFKSLNITEIDWDTLWQNNGFDDTDGNGLPEAVFDFLIDLTRNRHTASLERVVGNIENSARFRDYLFRQLKEKISSDSDMVLTDEQLETLKAWVDEKVQSADIPDAIKSDEEDPDRFSYDRTVMVLWYYISRFKIKVENQKLLDFTLYSEPRHNQEMSLDFDVLEELAGKASVKTRVAQNLQEGISYDGAWKNNALYALDSHIVHAYPLILKELGILQRSSYSRDYVLKKYWERTGDSTGLATLFERLGRDELRWSVADLLSTGENQEKIIQELLLGVLKSQYENDSEKFKASKYLTKLGEITGTRWYLQKLREKTGSAYDFYHEASYLRAIKNPAFIPDLISLLIIANEPEMKTDNFNRLDSYLADALFAIGLASESNLKAVKDAVEDFINSNKGLIKDVNFYYPMLDKMEYHFWLAKSQQGNIDDAIAEVKKLS